MTTTPGARAGCVIAFLAGVPLFFHQVFHENLEWGGAPGFWDFAAPLLLATALALSARWAVNRWFGHRDKD